MTVTVDGETVCRQLMVGPEDGYGDVALERVTLAAGPWPGPEQDRDRLVVVLAGQARVTVPGSPAVTLAPNEVVHVGRGRGYVVDVLCPSPSGSLELLVLAGPGGPR